MDREPEPVPEPMLDVSSGVPSATGTDGAEQPPGGRRRWLSPALVIVATVLALGLVGGALAAFLALRGTGDVIERMVPANSTVYVTAFLDPSASQKLHLRSLAGRFPGLGSTAELNRRIDQVLDGALDGTGLTSKDVRPWLGSQLAVVVRMQGDRPLFAVLVASKDDTKARAALTKLRAGPTGSQDSWKREVHGGIEVWTGTVGGQPDQSYAYVDRTVVLANDTALIRDIIDTSQGKMGNLTTSSGYVRTVSALPKDRLVLAYVNPAPLVAQLKKSVQEGGAPDLSQISSSLGQFDAFTGIGATISAQTTGIALDLSVGMDRSKLSPEQRQLVSQRPHQSSVLAFTPQDAYGAFATTGFRQTMQTVLAQLRKEEGFADLDQELGITSMVGHLSGDAGWEARPGPDRPYPGGAFLVGTDDSAGMQAFLDRVAAKVSEEIASSPFGDQTGTWQHETYRGVEISFLRISDAESYGIAPAYAVSGGMAVIGSSPREVEAVLDARADGRDVRSSPSFKEAVGSAASTASGLVYIDVSAVSGAVREALDPTEQRQFDEGPGKYLAPMKAFSLTTQSSAERSTIRLFLVIR